MSKTTERMLNASKDVWDKYNKHPFVKGLEDGSLDKEKFRFYIIQDYLYLEDYARSFALGAAKAKSRETTRLFSGYISLLTGNEMDIHRGYMGKFGVTKEELENTPVSFDNLAYTSYMLRVSYEDGEPEILAAILSCAYSYEFIAKNILKNNPKAAEDEFYGEWVSGYASERYSDENKILLETLDRLTENYTEAQLKHLEEIFLTCSIFELNFWEMAWNMSR